MSDSRKDILDKIEQQRRSIREHIAKHERDKGTHHEEFALKTIRRCQDNIRHLKARADSAIADSYEDDWTP